jgi:polar amino acid transport system substrate-binding protein
LNKEEFVMKDVKKVLALVLIVVMTACMLAACGSKSNESAPAEDTGDAAPAEETATNYVIATDKGFSPFEFEDEKGNIVGIDMDILAAVAEDQGFTYDLHYIGWDAAIAECQAGQADGMIAGASITDERKENGWIFSDGYYDATQGMAVKSDSDIQSIDDLKGKTVVVKNGTMSDQYATELSEKIGFTVTRVSTSPDMYQQVAGGQAAACFDDTPILKYSIKAGELDMKFVEGTENDPAAYGMAIFNSDKQDLIDKFNAGLANIKANGKYDEIIKNYLG